MLIFYVVLALVVVSGCIVLYKVNNQLHVTSLSVAIVIALLAPWGVYSITAAISKDNDQTFYEYWNGSESSTSAIPMQCTRDGGCKHTYDCDPYLVTRVVTSTDSKGKTSSHIVTSTEYHHCPYSNQETTYIINTTVGSFTAGDALMTGEQFRGNMQIPGGKQTAPAMWVEAKNRIDSGNPSGATARHTYKNFILSADVTLFKTYSDKIDSLRSEGLLPTPVSDVQSLYKANKVYLVGDTKVDAGAMNYQLTQLDAYVGSQLSGDMHVVFVEASKAGDPTDYTNALKAYWSSEAVGKNAIAKNTVTLVVGVVQKDNKPVVGWATGFTGMPVGNEALIQDFSNLKDSPIEGNFIGAPKYDVSSKQYALSDGKVESMVTGEHKFARVSMSASDMKDNGSGFSYLSDSWHMKPEQLAVAIWISSILNVIILAIGTLLSVNLGGSYPYRDPVRVFIKNIFSKN